MRWCWRMTLASWRVVPTGTVTRFSLVIRSRTGRSMLVSKRRSRLVRMPTSLSCLHHGHAGDLELGHEGFGVADGGVRVDDDGIGDHARLTALHLVHFLGLAVDAEVLVDDADAPLLGQGDGQAALGDGVHGGGEEGDPQGDAAGSVGSRDPPGWDGLPRGPGPGGHRRRSGRASGARSAWKPREVESATSGTLQAMIASFALRR